MSEKAMGALRALEAVKAVRGEAYAEGLVDMANILAPQHAAPAPDTEKPEEKQ